MSATASAIRESKNHHDHPQRKKSQKQQQQQLSPAAAAAKYHKQLKYGIYEKPGAPVVGVSTSSSGEAAVLAAKSDLSLKLWQREKSSEAAGTAAVLANNSNTSPEIWRPDASASAASAALYVKDMDPANPEDASHCPAIETPQEEKEKASKAAISAHKTPAAEFAASQLPDAYAWGEDNQSSTSGGAGGLGRSASLHVYNKQQRAAARRNSNASTTYNRSRARSFHDQSQNHHNNNINLSGLESKARQRASQRLSGIYGPQPSVYAKSTASMSAERDRLVAQHAAASSSMAAKEDLGEIAEQERLRIHDQMLKESISQHESLMKAARERASMSLSQVDKDVSEKNLFGNAKYNQAALDIATKHSQDRMVNHGKIDVGGGLYLTQAQIDEIAQRNVQPVLNEISEKAASQRQADEERRQAEEAERLRKAEEKRINHEKKAEDKRLKREHSQKIKAEKQKQKAADHERKAILKQEQKELKEQRKHERVLLQQAAQEKAHAEKLAKEELAKVTALKEAAAAKVEAAKLKEEQAADEATAQQAKLEKEQHESELVEASAKVDTAIAHHAIKSQETKDAESVIDEHDRKVQQEEEETASELGIGNVDSDESTGVAVTGSEAADQPGLTMGAIQGPAASSLNVLHDKSAEESASKPGLTTGAIEGPDASHLNLLNEESASKPGLTEEAVEGPGASTLNLMAEKTHAYEKLHGQDESVSVPGLTKAALDGPAASSLNLMNEESASKPGLTTGAIEGPAASSLDLLHEKSEKGHKHNKTTDDDGSWEIVDHDEVKHGEKVGHFTEGTDTPVNTFETENEFPGLKSPPAEEQPSSKRQNKLGGLLKTLKKANPSGRIRGLSLGSKDGPPSSHQHHHQPHQSHRTNLPSVQTRAPVAPAAPAAQSKPMSSRALEKQPLRTQSDSRNDSASAAKAAAAASSAASSAAALSNTGGAAQPATAAKDNKTAVPLTSDQQRKFSGFSGEGQKEENEGVFKEEFN